MAEETGPPRKTKTYRRFEGMNSQRERYGVSDDEMFYLENIMRVAPKKLHSVPGPHQIAFFPIVAPPECLDTTERGQRPLTAFMAYRATESYLARPGENVHVAYGLWVDAALTFQCMVGIPQDGGGNMPYVTGTCTQSVFDDGSELVTSNIPIVPPENAALPAVNVMNGSSDEKMYGFANSPYDFYYPDRGNIHVNYAPPGGFFGNSRHFTKRGEDIFVNPELTNKLHKYDVSSGTFLVELAITLSGLPGGTFITNYYALDDRVVVICRDGVSVYPQKLVSINNTTGAVIDEFDISNVGIAVVAAVSNSIIYLLAGFTLYYLKDWTDLIYVGQMVQPPEIPDMGFSTANFLRSIMFFGGNNRNIDANGDIKGILMGCPEGGPVVASVTADSTVQRGNDLNISWADFLEPAANDILRLMTKIGDTYSWNGPATTLNVPTGGLSDGSTVMSIPGGATPGDYYIFLATLSGNVPVARSAVVTITA